MVVEVGRPLGIAIVTGAASGMGEATARLMADSGWALLLCDLNQERLEKAARQLSRSIPAQTMVGDIADPGFSDKLVNALEGQSIAALIHCAGLSPTMGKPARILEVNLAATMRLLDVARPRMAAGGAVVLFASTAGHMLGSNLDEQISKATVPDAVASLAAFAPNSGAAYSISKRGVQLLVRREAAAFGRRQARIISISPGIIDTPMGRSEMESQPMMKMMIEKSPLQRAAAPEEVAAVAVFLTSPGASFVTGTDILVDGGSLAMPMSL